MLRMVNDMSYKFSDVAGEMGYYLSAIMTNFKIKALISLVPTPFILYLGESSFFFEVWFALGIIDLIAGVSLALAQGVFCRTRLYGWVGKMLTHALTIMLFGVLSILLSELINMRVPLLDWFIFVLVITETLSVLKSAELLGMPVPAFALVLVEKMHDRAKRKADDLVDGLNQTKPEGENDHNA